jgi:predicted  nucleic acid-binding Zn-ribbon protein
MRADEITAITKALEVIVGGAKDVEATRAMLQVQDAADDSSSSEAEAKTISDHRALDLVDDEVGDLGVAFLQEKGTIRAQAMKFLKKTEDFSETSLEFRKRRVLQTLAQKGRKMGSAMLMATALQLGPDPFKKVKDLIQSLIEKILQQMADEAGHKGFCDTELGKSKTSRDFELEKTQKLSAELEKLEVTKETLEQSIETLTQELEDLNEALEKAIKMRDEEKEANAQTIKDSTEGLAAIKEAIQILKDFYKGAAKALLQTGSKASPIDEGAGTGELAGGSYKGKQKQGESIIGMLEVIVSDFERSITETGAAEDASHKSFVNFDRESKGSISAKETGKAQAETDLKETDMAIAEGMANLSGSQKLLDDALKAIEELVPACIDTGMSYEERVAKREEEIEALKTAVCQLDVEKVEADCP